MQLSAIILSPSRDASFYRVAYDAINFIAPACLPACERLDFHYRRDTRTIKQKYLPSPSGGAVSSNSRNPAAAASPVSSRRRSLPYQLFLVN